MSRITLTCPACKMKLVSAADSLYCIPCNVTYPIRDGIPFFSKGDYYFVEIKEGDIDELLSIARRDGWKAGLHDYLRIKDENTYKISCDESRLDWRFLFPLSKNSMVLDMGCGWGGISLAMSQRAGTVVSLDVSQKRLQCLNLRVRQDKIDNIVPICGGDSLILPFPDKSFDLVVLNGVLEWLGIFHHELSPRDVQITKLKDIRRILKDNGQIYVGIENRLGYVYFLGGTDHNKLRFTTLMPRKLADNYTKRKTGEGYRTYTYGLGGLRKLFKEAGFLDIDIYATIPTYRDVFFLANVNDTNVLKYFFTYLLQTRSMKRKIIAVASRFLLLLGIFKYFIPELGIVARKK